MVIVKKCGNITPREIECECCEALVEYYETDIVTRHDIIQYYGIDEKTGLETILCPACGHLIEVTEEY